MQQIKNTGQMITITRDGEHVATVKDGPEVMQWFHRHTSASMQHAITFEGYATRTATEGEKNGA